MTTASARPRRAEEVVLHEVPSEREGTRYVLEHTGHGQALDLPLGEGDAFVWARLDGEHSLEQIGAEYLEEFGAIHPDLSGLVDRLRAAELLSGETAERSPDALTLGERLARLAGVITMIRLPIPLTQHLWRAIGKVAAPFYMTGTGVLALLVGALGLGAALTGTLAEHGPLPLLHWPESRNLLLGLLSLLGLNLAVDLFEAVAQVAVLARGKRAPGRVGLSFDLGVPGIYMETPDAALLDVERRVRLLLAPLISAAFVGGAATLLYWVATQRGDLLPALTGPLPRALLHKLAWVAWLRCAVHSNPLGPSPCYDALSAWWSVHRLREQAWRFLRNGLDLDGRPGFDRREQQVLLYLGMIVVYALGVAQLGVVLLRGELLPLWDLAQATGARGDLIVLGALLVVVLLPTLLALSGGALLLLQATAQALEGSEIFEGPARQAALFAALSAATAVAPAALGLGPNSLGLVLLWPLAALLALATAGAGARLARIAGNGWGTLGGHALTLAGLALLGWTCLEAQAHAQQALMGESSLLVGYGVLRAFGLAAALAVGAAGLSWGVLEAFRWAPGGATSRTVIGLAALWLLASVAWREGVEVAAGALALAAALAGATSAVAALGSRRWPGLLLAGAGFGVWGGALLSAHRLPSFQRVEGLLWCGIHFPLLAAGLLAGAAWTLAQARLAPLDLPAHGEALPREPEPGQAAPRADLVALGWVLRGLIAGARQALGVGACRAIQRAVREHGLAATATGYEDLGGDADPLARRLGLAVVRAYQEVSDRGGDALAERLIGALAQRLPARAHEALRGNGATLLPELGALQDVLPSERARLLRRVVHFTDFSPEALAELADLVGCRLARADEVLIRQGDEGDTFFVLVSGRARVIVEDATGEERVVARLGPDDAFGEAALLTHEPRSATVWIERDALLLTLERETFAAFLRERRELLQAVFARQADLSLVREVPLFAHLNGGQVTALCRRFAPLRVEPEDEVIRQGDVGDRFYLIREGRFEVRHDGATVATLGRGEYFGEIALLQDVPRTASVVAEGEGELLALGRDDFRSLLGGVTAERLARRTRQRLDELGASGGGGRA
ncbi:MAG: cyclic nucleotide-binding domain-containing protein [Planctomycetota bacterium]